MQITLTGSLGNISKPLATQLLAAGHTVTIISSQASKAAAIETLGAKAAIGSIADVDFLTQAFTGADAVYTMIPPNFAAPNYRQYQVDTAQHYIAALQRAGVTRVVNLSSIGAHLSSGTGMIAGMYDAEQLLNAVASVAVVHVRAPFFFTNFYGNVEMIKHQGIIGSNYAGRLLMVHPADIAATVADALQASFSGHSVRYVYSDDLDTTAVAQLIGAAMGKPSLPWVAFEDGAFLQGLQQGGMPAEIARNFVEMGTAVRSGVLWTDFDAQASVPRGTHDFAGFVKEYALAF